ncbi:MULTISPECIES: transglutaminaseTgpA domain-containing protein [unclassified Micromonospora]|uniref:transglutaminase family protein n=1 Tax=unclassified Micromonospora TaxID=2617518 RepID=UPI00363004D3
MSPRGGQAVAVPLGLLATVAGGLLYRGFFTGPAYLVPLLVAILAGLLFGLVVGQLRSATAVLLGGCGLGSLLAAYLAFPGTLWHGLPGPETGAAVLAGVTGGWARMLSTQIPAEATGDLLVAPILTSLGAAAGTALLSLRTRSAVAPVVPPLVAFVVALVLSGPAVVNSLPATTLFVTAVAGMLAARRPGLPGSDRTAGRRSALRLSAVAAVAAVAAAGLSFGPVRMLAPGVARTDAGRLLRPPIQVAPVVDPLSTVRTMIRQTPPQPLFSLDVLAGSPSIVGDRARLIALDRYDGVLWSTGTRHLPVGRAPVAGTARTDADEVRFRVTLDELTGPFLPVVGRPRRVVAETPGAYRFGAGDGSGTLVTDATGPIKLGYVVTSDVRTPDAGFDTAVPGGLADPHLRELPGEPPRVLTERLSRLTASVDRPVARLRAIESYLRSSPYDVNAPPGHSYAALERVHSGNGAGHAEQRASAFAVMARMLGYPARVVVGFRLLPGDPGRHRITTREAHAWPEVHFDRYGWIPFEPTGSNRAVPDHDGGVVPIPPVTPAATPEPSPSPSAIPAPSPDVALAWVGSVGRTDAVPALAATGLLVVLALLPVPVARTLRRRRRRHRGTPDARVTGAWAEVLDQLRDRRVQLTPGMTPVGIARRAARDESLPAGSRGAPELMRLAEAVTAAVFAADRPDESAVRTAWERERRVRRWLRYPPMSYRRYLAWFDPRVLLPRRLSHRPGSRHSGPVPPVAGPATRPKAVAR